MASTYDPKLPKLPPIKPLSVPYHDEIPPIGRIVRFKKGNRFLEFRGIRSDGKFLLFDPERGVIHFLNREDMDW